MAKQPKLKSPLQTAQEELRMLKLEAQLAEARGQSVERMRLVQAVQDANQSIEEVSKDIAKGKLPTPAKVEQLRARLKVAGPDMEKKLVDIELQVDNIAKAKADQELVKIAQKAGLKGDISKLPGSLPEAIKTKIRTTGTGLSKDLSSFLVTLSKESAAKQADLANRSGFGLISAVGPRASGILQNDLKLGTDTAVKVAMETGVKEAKAVKASLLGDINKGIATAVKGNRLKVGGGAAVGGGILASLLLPALLGTKKETGAPLSDMPTAQQLFLMKQMSDIQTQEQLAQSLIGLRELQGSKAASQRDLAGLQAMQLMQSLNKKAMPGVF